MKIDKAYILAILITVILFAQSRSDDWPQWRADAQRSATIESRLPDRLSLVWIRQMREPVPAWPASQPSLRFDVSYSPVAAEGLLFVPSMVDDSVRAFELSTGEERWRFSASGPIRTAAAWSDGRLLVGSDDGFLYCVEAKTGRLCWKFDASPYPRQILGNRRMISTWPIRSAPTVLGGQVYFSAGIWPFMGVFYYCIDIESGQLLWSNSGDSMNYVQNPHDTQAFSGLVPRGYPAIADDKTIQFAGGRTPPGSLDLKSGAILEFDWAKKGGRAWNTSGDGRAIVVDGEKIGVDRDHPNQLTAGRTKIDQPSLDAPIWSILTADGKLIAVTEAGTLYCFGAATTEGQTQAEPTIYKKPGVTADDADRAKYNLPLHLKVNQSDVGYCLIVGLDDEQLPEELCRLTDQRVVVVDADTARVERFRRRMQDAGLYGEKLSALAGDIRSMNLSPYFARRVIVQPSAFGRTGTLEAAFQCVRPYGGVLVAPTSVGNLAKIAEKLEGSPKAESADSRWSRLTRHGALPGAADWTHQYADAGNSVVSEDSRLRAPLGVLWFGCGPSNDEVLPRHGHGPAPQVAAGRLVIEGPDMLRCVDIYTGQLLWQKSMEGLGKFYNITGHQPGANEIGSNYVTLPDAVYVVQDDTIYQLDPETGTTCREYVYNESSKDTNANCDWGMITVSGNYLVATAEPVEIQSGDKSSGKKSDKNSWIEHYTPSEYASAGMRIVVFDRRTGRRIWEREARYGFRHNNIVIGRNLLFVIDGMSADKLERLSRRGVKTETYRPELLALKLADGNVAWKTGENVFGTFLSYSNEHDVLLQAGSSNRDRARDEVSRGAVAYQAANGKVLWHDPEIAYSGPFMLCHDRIYDSRSAYSLLTGERIERVSPISGRVEPWYYFRNYGCNTPVASQNMIFFRSGAAGYYDLENDGGTSNLGGFKSSCTSNLIAAGGLLNAPEYTRTCTCNYQNQTSLAMIHDPRVEQWSFLSMRGKIERVVRLGLNFGAYGDRKDSQGTVWLDSPNVSGSSPEPALDIEGQLNYFRIHSSWVKDAGAKVSAEKLPWVSCCGVEGIRSIRLQASDVDQPKRFKVRLYFMEPSAPMTRVRRTGKMQNKFVCAVAPNPGSADDVQRGERIFDIEIEGETVAENVDIVSEAGGVNRPVVKEYEIEAAKTITIDLNPAEKSKPPILSGIEVVAL